MTDNKYRLSPQKAQQKIREIAKLGWITPRSHCQERMKERGFDMQDLEYLLSNCMVTEAPEYDKKHDDWKYKATGYAIDGDKATVVTVIVGHREVACITIMDK